MVESTDSSVNNPVDPELERLKQKSAKGAMNIIGDLFNNPEIQQSIKKIIMRKFSIPIVAVFCLFIGILGLFDVAKQILGLGWQVEIVICALFVLIGLIYLLKNMFTGKKNAD